MRQCIEKIKFILNEQEKKKTVFLFFLMVVGGFLELVGVAGVFPVISAIASSNNYGMDYVAVLCIGLICIYIAKNLFLTYMFRCIYRFSFDGRRRLSTDMFERYLKKPYSFHLSSNVAVLQRSVRADVDGFFNTVKALLQLTSEIIICFILSVMLFCVDFQMALFMSALLLICVGAVLLLSKKRIKKLGKDDMQYSAEMNKWLMQGIGGVKEVKLLGHEDFFRDKYDKYNDLSGRCLRQQQLLAQLPRLFTETVCISGVMIWICVCSYKGVSLIDLVPTLSVFAVAAFRLLPSVGKISGLLTEYNFYRPKVDAVYEELSGNCENIKNSFCENTDQNEIIFKEKIELDNLAFSYAPDSGKVFEDVSFEIIKGRSVGIIGPSGAGKTTLVDIVMGLLFPDKGDIKVDGKSIYNNLKSWYRHIGYVSQTLYLFDDTIRNNIAFGVKEEDIDDDRIWLVANQAQISSFIRQLPNGLDTVVGDRGVRLSGGQRQRIAIARALYNNPELLILDEATSALDSETESAVMDAIENLHGQVTMLIIAHRMSTIEKCDSVYKITDKGTVEKVR